MDIDYLFRAEETTGNENELINLLLNSKLYTLGEEDRQILENRELLKNELHTLQNVNPDEINNFATATAFCAETTENEAARTALSDGDTSRNELGEFELLIDPSSVDQKDFDASRTSTITNLIQNQDIKNLVDELNVNIEINLLHCREAVTEAKALLKEKMNLQRELSRIDNEIKNYNVEEAKLKKLKRKRGTDSAYTGVARLTYFCRFGMPYFKTADYFNADRNSDCCEIARSNQKMFYMMPKVRRFLPQDGRKLIERVLEQLKSKRLAKLRRNLKQLEQNDEQDDVTAEQKRNILTAIADTEKVKKLQETLDWNIEVDFMSLETHRYSSDDYERVWNLMAKPTLSKDAFSDAEMNKLKDLVEKYGAQDWDRLASLLNTNRSGFMCFTKYMIMEKRGRNLPWTSEEDALLFQLCNKLKDIKKEESRTLWWRYIRRQFPQRTYPQLFAHWSYVLQPNLKKGRFTAAEHAEMERLVKEGKSWGEIAQIVENRSCVQIRSHFEPTMQEIKSGQWRQDEEDLLLALVDKYGTRSWKTISQEMKTRNRSQCRLKYMFLKKGGRKSRYIFRDFWKPDEQKLFNELLVKYGPEFRRISAELKTKSYNQCRYKYFRMRKKGSAHERAPTGRANESIPPLSSGRDRWTVEEEKLYTELLNKYSRNFRAISKEMKTKTYKQCRFKFFSMEKRKKKTEFGNEAAKSNDDGKPETETATVKAVAESNVSPTDTKLKKKVADSERARTSEAFEDSDGRKKSQKKSTSKRRDQTENRHVVAESAAALNSVAENNKRNVTTTKPEQGTRTRRRIRVKSREELRTSKNQKRENVDGISVDHVKSVIPPKNGRRRTTTAQIERVENIESNENAGFQKECSNRRRKEANKESTAGKGNEISEDNDETAKDVAQLKISLTSEKPKLSEKGRAEDNVNKKRMQTVGQSKPDRSDNVENIATIELEQNIRTRQSIRIKSQKELTNRRGQMRKNYDKILTDIIKSITFAKNGRRSTNTAHVEQVEKIESNKNAALQKECSNKKRKEPDTESSAGKGKAVSGDNDEAAKDVAKSEISSTSKKPKLSEKGRADENLTRKLVQKVNQSKTDLKVNNVGNVATIETEQGTRTRQRIRVKSREELTTRRAQKRENVDRIAVPQVKSVILAKNKELVRKASQPVTGVGVNNVVVQQDEVNRSKKTTPFKEAELETTRSFNRQRWSASEVKLLEQLYQKYGHEFTKISQEMKTRSPAQCRSKYLSLKQRPKEEILEKDECSMKMGKNRRRRK